MLCTEIVSDIQKQLLYTTCSPHFLQNEEVLTKIYLYCTQLPLRELIFFVFYIDRCLNTYAIPIVRRKNSFFIATICMACIYNNALGLQELSECMLHGIWISNFNVVAGASRTSWSNGCQQALSKQPKAEPAQLGWEVKKKEELWQWHTWFLSGKVFQLRPEIMASFGDVIF